MADCDDGAPARSPRVLLVKTGTTNPEIVARHGDYDDWFRLAAPDGIDWVQLDAYLDQDLPDPRDFDGVLVTGSPLSVRDEAPWMAPLGSWMVRAAAQEVPVLAVCFGHQLVGEALGGRVGLASAGRELGTTGVQLTAAGRVDPLFDGLPDVLSVQQTHGDSLVEAPEGAGVVLLAHNEHTAWQAFAWGPKLRAVQFHPEADPLVLGELLATRGQVAPLAASDHGRRLLANWVRHWIRAG